MTYAFECIFSYRARVTAVNNQEALNIYTRSSMFNDPMLATAFFEKAALVPPHKISIYILRQILASALSALVCFWPIEDRSVSSDDLS